MKKELKRMKTILQNKKKSTEKIWFMKKTHICMTLNKLKR